MELQQNDRERILKAKILSPLAVVLLDKLFLSPTVMVKDVQRLLETSYPRANELVSQFEKMGILREITGGRRNRRFIYAPYVEIIAEGTQQ
jgi:Fic family protein